MKKRSLMAIGLAGVMAIGMCMPVLAADVTAPGDTAATITYEVPEAYSVSIPTAIALMDGAGTVTLSAKDVMLNEGATVKVTAPATVDLKAGGKGTAFVVKFDATEYVIGALNATATKDLAISPSDGAAVYAGAYTGTATFTVAYVAAP